MPTNEPTAQDQPQTGLLIDMRKPGTSDAHAAGCCCYPKKPGDYELTIGFVFHSKCPLHGLQRRLGRTD